MAFKAPIIMLISALLYISALHCQARSIPDSKRQLIDTIMKQTGTAKALPLLTNQLSGEILNMLNGKNVPMDQHLIRLVQQESKTVVYEEFVLSNKFNDIFYELYDEYFTETQLQEIVSFYSSSAGKRLLGIMPEISRRSIEIAQEHSKGIGHKVQQRLIRRFDALEDKLNQNIQDKASHQDH